MWKMIGVLDELERSLISERTRAGVKAAKRRGVKFGRKVKLTPEQVNHVRKLIDKGEARQYVAGILNVGRSTLYSSGHDLLLLPPQVTGIILASFKSIF
jgi:DNA invertase Pin-like site-specific DNA recombinase